MTLARDIIRRGFREDNLIPAGTNPTAAELTEGLELLNSFMLSVYGYELGEPMEDWVAPTPQRTAPVAANYPQLPYPMGFDFRVNPTPAASDASVNIYPFPPANSRLVWNGLAMRAYLPEAPRPGARFGVVQGSGAFGNVPPGQQLVLDGNGRRMELPDGTVASQVTLVDPIEPLLWFYRPDTAVWRIVKPVELDGDIIFPPEYDDFWIGALSIRLAPRYSKTVSQDTMNNTARMLAKMRGEFRQVAPTVYKSDDIPRPLESFMQGRWSW